MTTISVHLFGRPRISAAGESIEIANRKALALLAYLAISDAAHSREHVAALLWPEYSQTRALANLRRTVWLIKQTPAKAWLAASAEEIALQQKADLQVDVLVFQSLVKKGRGAGTLTPEQAAWLEEAASLYQADFLDEFYLADSEGFEDWSALQRSRLRQEMLQISEALAEFHLGRNETQQAQNWAWRQLAFDNLRERAYEQLMRSLAMAGQRNAALAQYETLRSLLDEELGVEPSEEVRQVFEAIRRDSIKPAESPARPAAPVERAPITAFMFTDIEGSTALWDQHRQAMLEALIQHNRLIEEIVAGHGGRILKSTGDGYLALFEAGDPLACALAIQKAMAGADWGEIREIRVRIGLHGTSSEWEGYDFFLSGEEYHGPLINYTSRVMDACWGGQIMVSSIIREHFSLPEEAEWVDFGEQVVKGAEEPVHLFGLANSEQLEAGYQPPRTTAAQGGNGAAAEMPAVRGESPYRGLYAFREQDAPFFYGREAFTERLLETVRERSMVAVIGPSGSGKSSVVHAGLLAQLRKEGSWLITSFRPGSRPFQSLAASLVPHLEPGLSETDALVETNKLAGALQNGDVLLIDVVLRILSRHPEGTRFPLVGDQFEELYTLVPEAELRNRFMDTLTDAVFDQYYRSGPKFVLILTLRADFLGQALAHRPFADAVQDSDIKLGPMTQAELGRAIVNPAKRLKVEFEAGLVQRILEDVGDEPGNLPLLEFALAILWDRQASATLTHEAYEAIEKVDGALARHADEVFEALSENEQARARRIFTQVVRPGEGTEDTRRLATMDEIGLGDWNLVQQLADARLLVTGRDSDGSQTVEVVHEALIRGWGRLQGWMTGDREFRIWQERLRAAIRGWQAIEKDESALLRGAGLATAETWIEERPAEISQAELDFVESSIALRDARQLERERRRRRSVYALAGGLVIAIVLMALAGFGWNQASQSRAQAEQNAAQSQSLALAANALQVFDTGRRELALALAMEAVSIDNPPLEAEKALAQIARSSGTRLVLEGHEALVRTFTVLPGEKQVISGSGRGAFGDMLLDPEGPPVEDYSVRLWDLETGEQIWLLEGHTNSINEIAVSQDGKTAVSASMDGSLIVWDLENGTERQRFEGHEGRVVRVFLNPDGRHALSLGLAYVDNPTASTLIRWDIETGEEVYRLENNPDHVRHIEVTPDGQLAVLGLSQCDAENCHHLSTAEILLLDVRSGEIVQHVDFERQTPSGVFNIAMSPDGSFAAVLVINPPEEQAALPEDLVLGLRLELPSGEVSASNSFDQPIDYPVISPDGNLVAGLASSQVVTVETAAVENVRFFDTLTSIRHNADTRFLAFTQDEEWIMTAGSEGAIIFWNVEGGTSLFRLTDHGDFVTKIEALSSGREVISSGGGTLRVWKLVVDGGEETDTVRFLRDHEVGNIAYVDFTPDGSRTLSVSSGEPGSDIQTAQAVLWDWQAGRVIYNRLLPENTAYHVGIIHPDGKTALLGGSAAPAEIGSSNTIGLLLKWDLEKGEIIQQVENPEAFAFKHAAFSPDGKTAVTGEASGVMRWWDYETMEVIQTYPSPGGFHIYGVAFTPDGQRAFATGFGTFYQWDLESGDLLQEYDHEGIITSISISPDGARFLSTSNTGSLTLWDLGGGEKIRQLIGHENGVSSAVFLPDGVRALSSDASGVLILWNLDTGEILREFTEHGDFIWRVALSPDGDWAATAAQDGTVVVRLVGELALDELIAYTLKDRYVPELTCDQRAQFRVMPLCEE